MRDNIECRGYAIDYSKRKIPTMMNALQNMKGPGRKSVRLWGLSNIMYVCFYEI